MSEANESTEQKSEPVFDNTRCVSFEEFSLYYDTADKVTERRQTTNRWNYSVCVALLVGISALVKLDADKSTYLIYSLLGIVALSLIAAAFCLHWLRQIEDFKALNKYKFEVLNEMAPRLKFENPESATSYEPLLREWMRLEASQQATKIRGLKDQIALKSSDPEIFMPKAFIGIFLGVVVLAIGAAILAFTAPGVRPLLPFSVPSSASTPSPTSHAIKSVAPKGINHGQ